MCDLFGLALLRLEHLVKPRVEQLANLDDHSWFYGHQYLRNGGHRRVDTWVSGSVDLPFSPILATKEVTGI